MGKAKNVVAGAAVAAAVAAAVTIFFTSTKKGQETSAKIKKYATELGQKISEKCEQQKELNKKKYDEIVDKAVDEYAADKKLAAKVSDLVKTDLKKRWTDVEKASTKKPAPQKKTTTKKK
ncbi:hypothetical protein KKC88_01835 [Patescibacteria group bacterium]|nr:hypothetical protein [Patescibacteria group bacterium]MBU1673862.1 hypothetical protein [Patescibacteria group bacterium]MBU1963239.1 hypothetical protein [Patescibacteria group bacterium]